MICMTTSLLSQRMRSSRVPLSVSICMYATVCLSSEHRGSTGAAQLSDAGVLLPQKKLQRSAQLLLTLSLTQNANPAVDNLTGP